MAAKGAPWEIQWLAIGAAVLILGPKLFGSTAAKTASAPGGGLSSLLPGLLGGQQSGQGSSKGLSLSAGSGDSSFGGKQNPLQQPSFSQADQAIVEVGGDVENVPGSDAPGTTGMYSDIADAWGNQVGGDVQTVPGSDAMGTTGMYSDIASASLPPQLVQTSNPIPVTAPPSIQSVDDNASMGFGGISGLGLYGPQDSANPSIGTDAAGLGSGGDNAISDEDALLNEFAGADDGNDPMGDGAFGNGFGDSFGMDDFGALDDFANIDGSGFDDATYDPSTDDGDEED